MTRAIPPEKLNWPWPISASVSCARSATLTASFAVEPGEDDAELVAAEATGNVGGANGRPQRVRERAQRLVAGHVAADVVDPLQPVEVDDQERQVLPRAQASRDGRLELLLEQPAVVEAGELVARGGLLQLGEENRVSDGDGDDVAKGSTEVDRGLVPDPVSAVDDLHEADGLPARNQRQHQQRLLSLALE